MIIFYGTLVVLSILNIIFFFVCVIEAMIKDDGN